MPKVKMQRRTTVNDMTPFVDVAFLILFFFIMATKFKPPEPVKVDTPSSTQTEKVEENNALLVEIDKEGKVYFTIRDAANTGVKRKVIENLNKTRNLGLTEAQIVNFTDASSIGVPFNQLGSLLKTPAKEFEKVRQPGIPVDTASNELTFWIRDAVASYAGTPLNYFIKADNKSKYPVFKAVVDAFKKNEIFKFKLVTMVESAPAGSALAVKRAAGGDKAASE